jgi:NAD(P)-dependent dehydrogenase (short-subunit alcohol dehydrogenase family)
LRFLSRQMALGLGPEQIAVNVVARPRCDRFQRVRDNSAANKRTADNTVLGRAGVPDDLNPTIASLLSEDNRWVKCERIAVSGGVAM